MSFLYRRNTVKVETGHEGKLSPVRSTTSAIREGGVDDVIDILEPHEKDNSLGAASSSVIQFYPEWCQCVQCIAPKRPISKDATCIENCRYALVCPPSGPAARIIEFITLLIVLCLMLWLLLLDVDPDSDNPSPAAPGGPISSIFFMEIAGLFLGIFMKCIGLPSLLGPLLLGIVLRNIEPINIFHNFEGWDTRNCSKYTQDNHTNAAEKAQTACFHIATKLSSNWIKPIRQIALTLILTRAGLELSPKQLKKLRGVVPLLAFGPCIVEATFCAMMIYVLFNVIVDTNKISLAMCFVAGFALAAVSPAVVVPGMLSLKKKGYGVDQGVPTLLIAASSIDDVLAISAYTICLGLALSVGHDDGEAWETYAGGPIGFVVGIFHGFVVGSFLHFIPAKHSNGLAVNRLILLLLVNLVSLFAYELIELVAGAGSLAVLVTSFIASFGWRSQRHWKKPMHQIEHYLAHLWTLFVPLLFGTIGREVDFRAPGFTTERILKILLTIVTSLIVRCTVTFFIVGTAKKLNYKERLFCSLSWIPKATVQAALAPLVLSRIRSLPNSDSPEHKILLSHGKIVVTTAVLAILLTAPLGSVLISLCGPKLLRKEKEVAKAEIEEEFPDGDGEDIIEEDFDILLRRPSRTNRSKSVGEDGVRIILPPIESEPEPQNLNVGSASSIGSDDSNEFYNLKGTFY